MASQWHRIASLSMPFFISIVLIQNLRLFLVQNLPLIEEWKKLSQSQFDRVAKNLDKLKQIKPNVLDEKAERIHQKVFKKLDCLDCANCCKSIPPIVKKSDQKRIANHLNLSIASFFNKYLKIDEDGDTVLNVVPCPFLAEDNKCNIYEVRPRACRGYPHTDNYQFSIHKKFQKENIKFCPAAYQIVKRLTEQID